MTGQDENRDQLFDNWAAGYDDAVSQEDGFPFYGYTRVLDTVARLADVKPKMRVLDVGIGTGNLAGRFIDRDCVVWGMDFSAEMLARANAKIPQATLIQADLMGDWSPELNRRFDRIVSSYVLHEFDLPAKLALLKRFAERLDSGGKIIVGDIAFPDDAARDQAFQRWRDVWDEDEYYWSAQETVAACADLPLHATYEQVSDCGGVLVFAPR